MTPIMRTILIFSLVFLVAAFRYPIMDYFGYDRISQLEKNDVDTVSFNVFLVRLIGCHTNEPNDSRIFYGTGWVIKKNTMITASHVIDHADKNMECYDKISNKKLNIIENDIKNDFAIVSFPVVEEYYPTIYCDAELREEEMFRSFGYYIDKNILIYNSLYGLNKKTGQKDSIHSNSSEILNGKLYGGMSGGPVLNEHDEVIGINISAIKERDVVSIKLLSDTSLCR